MSQKEKILNHLKKHGVITVKEIIYDLKITQGATRIKELIEDDHEPISRNEWKDVVREDGTMTQVRVYRYFGNLSDGFFGKPKHKGVYSGIN